ncbi:hypothetical protein BGX29_009805 [Mortierella sp. GBA35]|nr:hypothetical protein BGX29_009805 [Mortierella sp. GBA35]
MLLRERQSDLDAAFPAANTDKLVMSDEVKVNDMIDAARDFRMFAGTKTPRTEETASVRESLSKACESTEKGAQEFLKEDCGKPSAAPPPV